MRLVLEYSADEMQELYSDAEDRILRQHGFTLPQVDRKPLEDGGVRWSQEIKQKG
ncbi:MAG: hypothetical protein WC455_28895 [Dehalococcoidia bacterium]|jgi:hypothetical protein